MEVVSLNVAERKDSGTANANRLRKEGLIPCVMYGQNENLHFTVRPHDVKPLIYTPDFKLAEIVANGSSHRCVLREVQMHPVTDEIIHLDFLRIKEGRKVIVEIPIHFEGTSKGVKNGGTLNIKLRRLKVKLLPEKIISEVTVDITNMDLGDTVRVKDIEAIDGVEVLVHPNIPLASVKVPRVLLGKGKAAAEAEDMPESGSEEEAEENDGE